MLRSLRFRLPALFLLGVVVAGLVSAAIALRLFRQYAHDRAREQRVQRAGSAKRAGLDAAVRATRRGSSCSRATRLERATGDKIFYVGLDLFPGQKRQGLHAAAEGRRRLRGSCEQAASRALRLPPAGCQPRLPRGREDRCSSAARPSSATIVGREAEDRARPALARADRAPARWPSRRSPRRRRLRLVSVAADHDAGAGALARGGRGRSRQLRRRRAECRRRRDRHARRPLRRDGVSPGRGRGARAELPDDGLARAAHAADRDPRPRRGAARGRRRRRGAAGRVARR